MPWFISIPLPGPFGWGKRLGASKREKDARRAKHVHRAAGLVAGAEAFEQGVKEWTTRRNAEIDESMRRMDERAAAHKARTDERIAAQKARTDERIARMQARAEAAKELPPWERFKASFRR